MQQHMILGVSDWCSVTESGCAPQSFRTDFWAKATHATKPILPEFAVVSANDGRTSKTVWQVFGESNLADLERCQVQLR